MDVTLLNADDMARTLERLVYEVLERHGMTDDLLLMGIQRRGADLARRLAAIFGERAGRDIPMGTLDINLYRDDWTSLSAIPAIGSSSIPLPIDGKHVLLVDDVLYTGRTIRAALEAILDYGRPSKVELLVLVDRGHRELPICADYVGRKVNTSRSERVDVLLRERDGKDEARLSKTIQQ
jgi:pyrimidine operon attenuation protein/uracil phosphoribosyltransferase